MLMAAAMKYDRPVVGKLALMFESAGRANTGEPARPMPTDAVALGTVLSDWMNNESAGGSSTASPSTKEKRPSWASNVNAAHRPGWLARAGWLAEGSAGKRWSGENTTPGAKLPVRPHIRLKSSPHS